MLGHEQGRAVRRQAAQRLADEARALGVELRGRFVQHEVWGPHREERSDDHELALTAGETARFALGEVLDAEGGQRLLRSLHRVALGQAQVHRPQCHLLEHRSGDAGQLGDRILEADPDPRRELVERLAGHRFAIDDEAAARQRPADRARREAAGHEAERGLARSRWRPRARRSPRRPGSDRCRGGRAWSSRHSDTRRRAGRASVRAGR
ncbi:MAG: hypothetical protein WKF78_10205 [Candidatus Limnocylindrales bacterium]